MPYTIDQKLNEGLLLHKISVEHLAALAGLYDIPKASRARLYEAFRGTKVLDAETAEKLWELWLRIEDLINRAKPFSIAFNDPSHTHTLLELIGDRVEFHVHVSIEND